jgi:adenosylcobinamide-phosphate synthase
MIPFGPLDLLLAWSLDAAVGDPRWIPWPHPVVLLGRCAERLERRLRRGAASASTLLLRGALLWLVVIGSVLGAGWLLLHLLAAVSPLLGRAFSIYLAYAALSTRALDTEARAVVRQVRKGKLPAARTQLSRIVGRDTETLPEREVLRGCVETVAENASDGVVAPLFYLALGALIGWGPLLAVAYKAVNTLDSMFGYRDERYESFGKAAAKLDDLANWIPARLTALLASVVAGVLWGRTAPALRTALRDGRLHKSPNSGFPEAAFAGALGVRLGGPSSYRGVLRASAYIGDPVKPLTTERAMASLRLLWGTSLASVLLGALGVALARAT